MKVRIQELNLERIIRRLNNPAVKRIVSKANDNRRNLRFSVIEENSDALGQFSHGIITREMKSIIPIKKISKPLMEPTVIKRKKKDIKQLSKKDKATLDDIMNGINKLRTKLKLMKIETWI